MATALYSDGHRGVLRVKYFSSNCILAPLGAEYSRETHTNRHTEDLGTSSVKIGTIKTESLKPAISKAELTVHIWFLRNIFDQNLH